MKPSYLFRLDDICPTMNWENFRKLEKIFDKYDIKPIIGVIPDNQDEKIIIDKPKENFWEIIRSLQEKGWVVAQHGFQHKYVNSEGGILKINGYSEFAGLPYREQFEKIKKGKEILENNLGIKIEWWMAPAHSFDENTCKAIKELNFKYITDGIALYPFEKYGLIWIPQQIWSPVKKTFGIWTICIHPSMLDMNYVDNLDKFIPQNKDCCMSFDLNCRKNNLNIIYNYWWKFKYLIYKLIKK